MQPVKQPNREPDFEGSGKLTSSTVVHDVVGQVWLPKRLSEPPFVKLLMDGFIESDPSELELEIRRPDGSVMKILGHGVWLPIQRARRTRLNEQSNSITAIAELDALRVIQSSEVKCTSLTVDLTDNWLLRPLQRQDLDVAVGFAYKTIEKCRFTDRNGLSWAFERDLRQEDTPELNTISAQWHLYACPDLSTHDTTSPVEDALIPALEEILTLAGFARGERTTMLRWHFISENQEETYFRVSHIPSTNPKLRSPNDALISKQDFSDFVRKGVRVLGEIDDDARHILLDALIVSIPDSTDYIESRYLSLFAALESVLLIFRKQHNLEFLIRAARWKHVQKALHDAIDGVSGRFDNAERAEIAKQALIQIRRVPLEYAFKEFRRHFNLQCDDLWPLTDHSEGLSLLQLRNRLSHGAHLPRHLAGGVLYASLCVETLLQRMVMALLGWPIERSSCGAEAVSEWANRFPLERQAFMDTNKSMLNGLVIKSE